MKRVGKNFVFLIMFIIVGLFSLSLMKKTSPDEITNADSNIVSGVIETNEIDVNVKIPGKILDIFVEEVVSKQLWLEMYEEILIKMAF